MHRRRLPFLSLLALVASLGASVQAQGPTCREALDSLDVRTRENYAGHLLEVRGARERDYQRMLGKARAAARAIAFEDCFGPLDEYVRWFDDPHLFLFQNVGADTAGNAERRRTVELRDANEDAVRRALSRGSHDDIEGIWYDGPLRLAVVRDSARSRAHFVGLVLTPDTSIWPVGAVRAHFVRREDGQYDARVLSREFGVRRTIATVHKRTMLRLSPGIWGKAFPEVAAERGMLDTVDVHRPATAVRSKSVVIAIPSHDHAFQSRFAAFVREHGDDIRRTGLLIVDLRGNEGGGSQATAPLHPWIATRERRVTPYDSGTPMMLSSPAQIRYAKRFTGTDTSAFVRSLVARMEARPGALVPLTDVAVVPPPDSVIEGSWRVVMMVDRGTVSAGEVMVLLGLRSTRAVVVGQPTAGALDYQSTSIVSLGLADRRWALGYPTITAHADLPRRGMRGKGIAPHVRIDWARIADPIAEVERRFAR